MVGKGSESLPQANTKQSFILKKGKSVEVSSDVEGFKGAWYLATIVDSPPKSGSKKRKMVMVEYKTLLSDKSSPLVEPVNPALIRPLPPNDSSRVFQVNDVVDAGYRDGWWTGVVRKVLGGYRYRVYIDNPPDVMDFDAKDLRSHWEWVNGNWVSPENQQTTGSIFSSGTEVEVKIEKENAHSAWFPAVVVKENEDGKFLVKCQNSGNCDETGIKVAVDSCHVRPIPPRYANRNYELLEKVDVPYNSGWRPGVITKLLPGKRYNVFFKQGNEDKELNQSEIRPHVEWTNGQWICKSKEVLVASDTEKRFDCPLNNAYKTEMSSKSETNGKIEPKTPCFTLTSVKNPLEESSQRNEKSSSHVLTPSKKVKLAAPTCSRPSKNSSRGSLDVPLTVSPPSLMNMPNESQVETLPVMTTPRTYGKRSRNTPMAATPPIESPLGQKGTVTSRVEIRIKELPEKNMRRKSLDTLRQNLDIVTKRGQSTKTHSGSLQIAAKATTTTRINESEDKKKETETPLVFALEARANDNEEKLKMAGTPKKKLVNLAGVKIVGLDQQTPGGRSQRRKRGRPCKLLIKKASNTGEDDDKENVADKSGVGEKRTNEIDVPIQKAVDCAVSQTALRDREVSEKDCKLKEVDMVIPDMVDEDQPLSMWRIGGMHLSANAEDFRLSSAKTEKRKRHVDQEIISCVDDDDDDAAEENHSLPFVKRSMAWKTIDSMEVFQMFPQKPHFQPLADSKEEYREGSAIGAMVTFATLFDKIASLKFNDSVTKLESTLESLADLERHGFDVMIPRDRVNQLLSIKDGKDKFRNESKDAENQMKEHSDERTKFVADAKIIEKKIAELEEEVAAAKLKVENKDREIASLQARIDSMNVQINEAPSLFEKLASAPWKIP